MARKPLEGIRCYTDKVEWSKRLLGASCDKENKVFDENLEKKLSNQKKLKRRSHGQLRCYSRTIERYFRGTAEVATQASFGGDIGRSANQEPVEHTTDDGHQCH